MLLISTAFFIASFGMFYLFLKEESVKRFAVEGFIEKWLKNNNGTIATYIQDGELEDDDLVKGREALSETLGLWMEYSLLKEDQALFEDAYTQLKRYFLDQNGFVYWKLTESGKKEVSTNALVDDLRISRALFQAGEKWKDDRYDQTAKKISKYIVKHNLYEMSLTDFYDKKIGDGSKVITLSYIEPDSLKQMEKQGVMDKKLMNSMFGILKNAPVSGAFFPKSYNVEKKEYQYDQNVNLVDQSLVAYYREKNGYSTKAFNQFVKREIKKHGVIYGQYDRTTGQPIVEYESPAIYAWIILYCLELNDKELAKIMFEEMAKFQTKDSEYYGGYSIYKEDTHIFDNLVPLLAEREMYNRKIIQ
ncbi:hypothetical protein BTO28_11530 [Domibacillus epiphyticus]|uniref:Glycosyl hydrolase n=2 Tax=Domibacillus epiphyticus TaxID=1714355 RepID=A0A1V2A6N3_9BACI|nr:hypothetical protein BTO28_11530 [Domibacillus epiphyticus]